MVVSGRSFFTVRRKGEKVEVGAVRTAIGFFEVGFFLSLSDVCQRSKPFQS